jgi:prevent-host-death family protein
MHTVIRYKNRPSSLIWERRRGIGPEHKPPRLTARQATGEPVIITQHGRSASVLLDVDSSERLLDELALLRDVQLAEAQIAAGNVRSHAAPAKALRARLKR